MLKFSEHVALGSAIIGMFAAGFGIYTQMENLKTKKSIDALDASIRKNADLRAQKDIEHKYDLAVYQEVVKFIDSDKAKLTSEASKVKGDAIIALVLSSTTDGLKQSLISVISSAKDISPAIATKAGEVFDNISAINPNSETSLSSKDSFPPPPTNFSKPNQTLSNFRIVVFHCESNVNNDPKKSNDLIAESLLNDLKGSAELGKLGIKWESKKLLNLVNSSPGYGINSNQIRYNTEDGESNASVALKNYLESSQTAKSQKINFSLVRVNQRTPNYLSVFVCNS